MTRQLGFGKNKNQNASNGAKQNQWVHPSEALLRGHIVYTVKFLGHIEVEQPKGIDVVKDAIRKMKFNKDLKKAEGQKPPKVELTISVDGVTVQEPKYKVIQHRYPLHRISYCADDKSDKRMFTFIAKETDSDKHNCFVFYSDKCAEEITLTIGQAFDLAYKKFMETSTKDIDVKKQFLLLQKKVQQLTQENLDLKARVADLERLVDPQQLEDFDRNRENAHKTSTSSKPTEVPVVGRRLENLVMDDPNKTYATPHTNGVTSPTAKSPVMPLLAPPPPVPPRQNMSHVQPATAQPAAQPALIQPALQPTHHVHAAVDVFGGASSAPQSSSHAAFPTSAHQGGAVDPFGMPSFNPSGGDIDTQLLSVNRELLDLQTGFSQGLFMGTEDFNLDSLDPLKN